MVRLRKEQIFKNPLRPKLSVGVILGVLGRQGSTHILSVFLLANRKQVQATGRQLHCNFDLRDIPTAAAAFWRVF